MKKLIYHRLFPWIDHIFRKEDRSQILRTKNILLIPDYKNRKGGKRSYGEWAHVIGIFQTLIYQNLSEKTGNNILDIGCGTGLLGISSEPFIKNNGGYTGIEVSENEVLFNQSYYPSDEFKFIHFNVHNARYAATQSEKNKPWPIQNESQDMVTALSVWTHLPEEDAIYYFQEIARVLKKGGKAIVTFFYLDVLYQDSLKMRQGETGRYHLLDQKLCFFDKPAYASDKWMTTAWAKTPEDIIGITETGMDMLLNTSKLKLINYYPGNWKEQPGIFFQDVLVFEKHD